MKSPLRKITFIFLLIILLPVIIISLYEIGSLNENEEMVKEIYRNQLDAILYSINQYSDDIVQSWANDIEQIEVKDSIIYHDQYIQTVVSENWSVNWVALKGKSPNQFKEYKQDTVGIYETEKLIGRVVAENKDLMEKLERYQEGGFRKIEPIEIADEDKSVVLFFVLDKKFAPYKYAFISISPELFIAKTLSPKIQSISEEKFIISAYDIRNDAIVFSTSQIDSDLNSFDFRDSDVASDEKMTDVQRRDFWLLPSYYLGIAQVGVSLDQLIRNRTYTNLGLLFFLIAILTAGLFFLYRNVRREVQLSQAKSEFVSNVSHEIRTPLSLIQMFAETLEMNRVKTEEKKHEYYNIIRKESERLSRIVNRILSFSQIEARKRRFEMSDINLKDLCDEILASYDFHLKNKGFDYDYQYQENIPAISGDKEAISEAIINLVDNAIKYSVEKKQLDISISCDDRQVYLKVKDYGIGIARQHQHEVFDQFFRVPSNNVHNTKGSGLGLTLVKHIMDAHHGSITLDSAPGKGSTFTMTFPAKT